MKVSIVIPNYNGEELLKKNLPVVFEASNYYSQKSGENTEIVIVDDASTDNSLDEIQNAKSKSQNFKLKLKSIKNKENVGFALTANRGVKEAEGEIIVLLNTDVIPQKDFLEPLINHFKDEEVFAVGCMDKSIEGDKIVLRGRGIGSWQQGFLVHRKGEINKTNTLWVTGGSGAFRKSIWNKLNGFSQLYNPFYWEDIDLSYRAQKSGYKVLFEPNSIVVHEHEKGSIKKKYSPFQIKTITYKNQIVFSWKNITDYNLLISHVAWLPYHLFRALINFDVPFLLGFFNAFFLLPSIIFSRYKTKQFFVKTDKEIIQELGE